MGTYYLLSIYDLSKLINESEIREKYLKQYESLVLVSIVLV